MSTSLESVRDLGIYRRWPVYMRMHVKKTVSCCFAALRQLRQSHRYVPTSTFQKLVVALVHSRLDYAVTACWRCWWVFLPTYCVDSHQSVLNAATRLIFNLKRSIDHITDALVSLHWLRVPERIQYKIAVLSYKVLHDTAPQYLGPLTRIVDIPGRRALRSACTDRLEVPYFKLSTIGGRAFPVAASQIWKSLPDTVVSASTLRWFQHQLKTFLFQRSFIY